MLDMSLTFFMTLTLVAFCAAQHRETDVTARARFMWLAWASAAAAFLTKGLVAGVIPVLSLAGYSLLQRDFAAWRRLHIGVGLVLFLLIAAPWLVLIQHRLPQFFDFFIVREHFKRFATLVEDRYQPWWFFLEVLVVGSLPWLVPMLRALATGWRAGPPAERFDTRRLLWVWSIVVLVFFSLSDSKLIPYILPMFPALALLAASAPEARLREDLRVTGAGLVLVGVVCLIGAALLPQWLHDPAHPARAPYFLQLRAPLVLMGLVALAGGAWTWRMRGATLPLTAVVGTTSYLFFGGVLWAAALLAPIYSGEALARGLDPSLVPTATVYSVRTYDQSLPFYLGRTVTLVDYRGELDFGLTLEPHRLIALTQFESDWREGAQALAVMKLDTYALLVRHNLPMVVRARAPDELIVSRR
jgi:4-amino-4-deoxy-L-arabinose transferase-like glycosyltransferase